MQKKEEWKMEIDLIIPWVNGTDEEWQKEKSEFTGKGDDDRINRYRDWGIMKYWFRSVEKNLPWIRKIHFVTWGHLPDFLDTTNPKINIVRHSDYIPSEYLPTYNSHTIELNFHRIEGLSEHFIYANDDMFFLKPLKEDFFFQNGLPLDAAIQNVLQFRRIDGISHITANNLLYVNVNFDKKAVIKANRKKWYSMRYGKAMLNNVYLKAFKNFTGFEDPHLPYAYLKSTWFEVWEKCNNIMETTSKSKIRSNNEVNQWLMRYWQLAKGEFVPCSRNRGKFLVIGKDNDIICKTIENSSEYMVCLSDDDIDVDFEKERNELIKVFEKAYPYKSAFEK